MTHLEELKAEIVKAVPEIMEIRRGTRVRFLGKEAIFVQYGNGTLTDPLPMVVLYDTKISVTYIHTDKKKDVEILGREITLADVLRAIGIKYEGHAYLREPAIIGVCIFNFSLVDRPEIKISWIMDKPLSGQSEETIDFIHSIICK